MKIKPQITASRSPLASLVAVAACAAGVAAGCKDEAAPPALVPHTDCLALDPVPRRLWRLSALQYGNAVKDLLGLDTAPVLTNNGGTSDYAFFSDDSVGVDSNFQFAIFQVVQTAMTSVAPRLGTLAACQTGDSGQDCAQRFARTFASRAFRRPVSDDEVSDLMGPFNAGADQGFNTGIDLMIEAVIQSPSFLFRTELGPPEAVGSSTTTNLTPYETATQLSFLLRNSLPDAPLIAAAADGSLATAQGVSTQVDRMLQLPEVRQNMNRIVGEWFNIRQVFSKNKSDDYFTLLAPGDRDQTQIQNDLYKSAQMFIDNALWSGSRNITELLTGTRVFVNQRLATMYGLPFPGTDPTQFVPIFPPDGLRAGMLTQPDVLWGLSNPTNTSIVKRGRFVHDDVICEDPAPSPGNLLSDPTIQAKLAMLPTEIEKSDYRMMTPQCNMCHGRIDPYARVLENFGAAGDYRTVADGVPVNPTADFSNTPLATGQVVGPPAFVQAINKQNLFTVCAVQKMASYALGRMIPSNQTCQVLDLHSEFQQTDGSITSLFRKVATASFLGPRSGGTQ